MSDTRRYPVYELKATPQEYHSGCIVQEEGKHVLIFNADNMFKRLVLPMPIEYNVCDYRQIGWMVG